MVRSESIGVRLGDQIPQSGSPENRNSRNGQLVPLSHCLGTVEGEGGTG